LKFENLGTNIHLLVSIGKVAIVGDASRWLAISDNYEMWFVL